MIKKIVLGLVILLVAFVGFVLTRESQFNYERSEVIAAPAERIFPYISDLKMGEQWSPYEKMDPDMKKNFIGPDGQVGSVMEFEGNSDVGAGKLEILKLVPNEFVELKLTMTEPVHMENLIAYKLTPEQEGTRFSWSMYGDSGFFGKVMSVFVDCEKMVGEQFTAGIANLKAVVEAQQ